MDVRSVAGTLVGWLLLGGLLLYGSPLVWGFPGIWEDPLGLYCKLGEPPVGKESSDQWMLLDCCSVFSPESVQKCSIIIGFGFDNHKRRM